MLIGEKSTMKNRIGTFNIDGDIVREHPDGALPIMARCVIVRAEYMFSTGYIEYTALCADFDEVPQGRMAPEYRAVMQRAEQGDVSFLRWERVKC